MKDYNGVDFEVEQITKKKNMKKSIYEISSEYQFLMNEIEQMEGEITTTMEAQLKINENELQSKSIAYLSVIKEKELFVSQIDEEIKRLTAIKKRNTNLIDRLKSNILNAVHLFGTIETKFNKFSIRKSESVEVLDVNELPKEFKVVKLTEQADKKAIKEALKSGIDVKGCSISSNENLKIN